MKSLYKSIFALLLVATGLLTVTSCSEDKLGETIFPEIDETLDPDSYTYKFDKWLRENYLNVYNLDFRYKMQDVGTDMNYNLVPAKLDNSMKLAVLTKYLWFDVYKDIVNENFLKLYGPRIIHLIGSPAYNPTSGTMILGLAEGGIKVSLFRVNDMDINDFNQMNEYYFKTMHHEFTHILHQTKTYPSEFNTLSVGKYDGTNWQDRQDGVVNSLGFVTNYASSEFREDFAETVANYIVKTDSQWARILELAARGWATKSEEGDLNAVYYCFYYYPDNNADNEIEYVDEFNTRIDEDGVRVHRTLKDSNNQNIKIYPVEDTDGVNGPEIIEQKVQIARTWLRDVWGVDLDALRQEVQRRQANYDIDALLQEIYDIQ